MTKRTAVSIAGATLTILALQTPAASAEGAAEIIEIGDTCYVENIVTEEKVVGTRPVAEPAAREGDWPVGDIRGPEGWTFTKPGTTGSDQDGRTVSATIPADTPAGEYTAQVLHFGYNKNQVSETVTFNVVDEDVTESRTWTERQEVPCTVGSTDEQGDERTDDRNDGHGEDDAQSRVLSDQASNFVDHKVLAQQQALNAPAAAPAAAAPAAEVTPEPTAQQMQLANNGLSGSLTALAVGLLAVAGGAVLMFRRRSR